MKILVLANNDVGLYKFRKELLEKLLEEHEVLVSLPDGEYIPSLINMGCKYIHTDVDRRGINPITDFKLILNYFKLLKKEKPDLIITYTIKPNLYGGLVSKILKIPYAINITGLGTAFQNENFIKKLVCFLYRISANKAKVVFFENEENMEIFINNKLISRNQAYLLHGAGVNLIDYPFEEYPIESDTIRFLFIGRIMKEKGIDELFNAAKRIKKEYPHIQFDIVGPMEDNYKEIIEQLDQNIINYFGFQSDVKSFIKQSHCFVLPSYHEGMANTLLECAAMGRPLITSNIHGCKEAVNGNGYLCNVKDENDLYDKLLEFIHISYEDKINMGYQSRKHVEEVFDKNKVVEETMKGMGV